MAGKRTVGIATGIVAGLALLACQSQSSAAGGGGAAPKKSQAGGSKKSPPKSGGPIVLGTAQLPGDFGLFDQTYTIGKSSPLDFTLNSAEYTVGSVSIGNSTYTPRADEKLLVLHYTVHNPLPREQTYFWGEMTFSAVDSQDVTRRFVQAVAREGSTEPLHTQLKPAQKIDAYTVIVVPAAGPVPKLIVEREWGAPAIRYDLGGKVKPLPDPFADPADASGGTALKQVPARIGTVYPFGVFDARLDAVAYTTMPLLSKEPGVGKRYLTAIVTLKNRTLQPRSYNWGQFNADLRDADGEKVAYNQTLLKGSRDEAVASDLGAGEETRVRFFFTLPQNVAGKTLLLSEHTHHAVGKARVLAFDVSSAK
jgi:hypothetical protein